VVNLGSALGAAIGGLAIISFTYTGMATTLGTIGIAAAIIYLTLAKDPTKT
jgi:predicted MFS family arabinose efflux permease